jgi:hypothetical protein
MHSLHALRNHLEMFQQTFSNALTDASPFSEQPPHLNSPLRIHQLAAIHSMREKEMNLRTGYQLPNGTDTLFSQYAFLGDRVGVGKTFMVLGHISQMSLEPLREQTPLSNLHPSSSAACFSISPQKESPNLFDSLIVVPHTIYRQWQDTLQTHTTLKVNYMKTLRDLDRDNLVTNLRECHVTLISNTLLPMFLNSLRAREMVEPTWRRVFYDEADTIKIAPSSLQPNAKMTWYVTASFSNMLFSNQYYHSYIIRQLPPAFIETLHPRIRETLQLYIDSHPSVTFYKTQSNSFFRDKITSHHPLRAHLVVLNSNEFLDSSITLPPITHQIIRCETPISHQLIQTVIPAETEAMLHAGDIQGALQSLGISSHSQVTIVEAVTGFRQRELDRLERLLVFKREETYATPQAKEAALKSLEEKIVRLKEQIAGIRQRIDAAMESKDGCSICFDTAEDPVITPCCSKIFCVKCIITWMQRTPACPLCRASIHPSQLCAITDSSASASASSSASQTTRLPKKIEALLKLLEENPTGKFLVFSRYENPLQALQENLSNTDSGGAAILQGNKDVIAHMLGDFESGRIRVLLLNSRNAAAGINIPTATHVVLLHKMVQEEEKQILGRAYRMGRTKPLQFIKLLHERE